MYTQYYAIRKSANTRFKITAGVPYWFLIGSLLVPLWCQEGTIGNQRKSEGFICISASGNQQMWKKNTGFPYISAKGSLQMLNKHWF